MKTPFLSAMTLAGLLLLCAAGTALAQTAAPAEDPHHPSPEAGALPPAGAGGMAPMMPPEMMRMMMQMMAQGGMMAGMGAQGAGGMAMPGMPGNPMQPGMAGMAAGQGLGPDALYGMAGLQPAEMTPDLVRAWVQGRLDHHGNPRLTLGEVAEAADGSITAEIRTVDGALVQKLAFNRYPGFVRQID